MKKQMEFGSRCLVAIALLAVVAVASKPALASPTYMTFDCPGVGNAQPTGINDSGVVAGNCGSNGFIRNSDGTVITFGVPGADATYVSGINRNGDVVGNYTSNNTRRPYVRTADGVFKIIHVLQDILIAVAINDRGEITGFEEGGNQGFIRSAGGAITTFAIPSAYWTMPEAINNGGEITGTTALSGELRGFVRTTKGILTTFKAPGKFTEAYGINNHGDISGSYRYGGFLRSKDDTVTTFQFKKPRFLISPKINDHGQIVGSYEKGEGICSDVCQAFLRNADGSMTKIRVPAYGNADATAINNKGWIAGSYIDGSPGPHGFIRTP